MPFAPGVLVLEIGQVPARPERAPRIIALGVLMFLIMIGIYALNRRAATQIQRRIDRMKEHQ